MAKNTTPKRFKNRLLKVERGQLRNMTTAEKENRCLSKRGEYLILRTTKKVSTKTPYITRSMKADFDNGSSHTTRAKLRKQGIVGYKNKAAEVQASNQRKNRERLSRYFKRLSQANPNFDGSYADLMRADARYRRLFEIKRGRRLSDAEWHWVEKWGHANNDLYEGSELELTQTNAHHFSPKVRAA